MKKQKAKVEKNEPVIYLGPTVHAVGLMRNRVYAGGADGAFDRAKEIYPLVMRLVVPVSEIDRTNRAINTKGTPQFLAYQQIGGKK